MKRHRAFYIIDRGAPERKRSFSKESPQSNISGIGDVSVYVTRLAFLHAVSLRINRGSREKGLQGNYVKLK